MNFSLDIISAYRYNNRERCDLCDYRQLAEKEKYDKIPIGC